MSPWETLLVLSIFALIIFLSIFLYSWAWEWSIKKTIEKRKKKFGADYQEEALRRFNEKYPNCGEGSYEYHLYYLDIEKQVLKERGAKRFDIMQIRYP